ncbi:hypothetical protein PWT90_06184 [Aphanocladium album]|nr:hypothetical protein PWT90_06184 [Aphanocladium album]
MERIHSLLKWAAPQGVQIRGIRPHQEGNSGIGMMATKNIQKGDIIMTVPSRVMRGLHTVSAATRAKLPRKTSIHSLLAAEFILHPPAENWLNVIPTFADFSSTPFFWPEAAQALLPGAAKRLLQEQQRNFNRDWEHVRGAFPQITWQVYAHAWFVVNTRAFYHETEETLRYPWVDRLALLPVADLFNHAAVGCQVSYSSDGYEIIADRTYSKGEEVCTSYGDHSNDFLLAEYGFVMQNNTHDRFDPEDLAPPGLGAEETALLKKMKTMVVLRPMCGPAVEDGIVPGFKENDEGMVDNSQLQELLSKFLQETKRHTSSVTVLDEGEEGYKAVLLLRWNQIEELVQKAIRLSSCD